MGEWLRLNIIGPVVAQLMAFSAPLRYAALLFLALLFVYLVPWRWLATVLAWPIKLLLRGLGRGGLEVQRLALGKPYPDRRFDQLDRWSEQAFGGLRAVFHAVDTIQAFIHQRLRLQRRWLLVLPLLVFGLYFMRPRLGSTVGTQMLDLGSARVEAFERWALVGMELPTGLQADEAGGQELEVSPLNRATVTPEIVLPTVTANPGESILNPIHVVQRGEILRGIAVRYSVTTQCIMQANAAQYPNQNWDSLSIGQEIIIPLNDPSCRQP